MRRNLCIFLFLTLALVILVAGCSQQAPPPATPVPTQPTAEVTTEPATVATTPVEKQISLSVTADGSDIIVKYLGGSDSADLAALKISIENYSLLSRSEREDNPVLNQEYVFPQMATASPDLVTVIGIFKDGTEQTLFMKKL